MAAGFVGMKIEVTGVGDTVDAEMVELLLESKRKMGRVIEVSDVTFNRDRRAALVTLTSAEDVAHVLKVSKVALENHDLYFSEPNMKLWTRSTICVHNVPLRVSEEEIELTFESRKIWGRELDVDELIRDRDNKASFIVFTKERDAHHVMKTNITKLFGVDIVLEGPMFLPAPNPFPNQHSDYGGKVASWEKNGHEDSNLNGMYVETEYEAIAISKAMEKSLQEHNMKVETPPIKSQNTSKTLGPTKNKRNSDFEATDIASRAGLNVTKSRPASQFAIGEDKNEIEEPIGGSFRSDERFEEPVCNFKGEEKTMSSCVRKRDQATGASVVSNESLTPPRESHPRENPKNSNDLDKETNTATPKYSANVYGEPNTQKKETNKDEPEVFTNLKAAVKKNILPKSLQEKNEWKRKLKRQFHMVDVREDEGGQWVVMGPWNQILEARSCLQMWYSQAGGDDDSDWELVNDATGCADNESSSLSKRLTSALNSIDETNGDDDDYDEEAIRKENEILEQQFANSDVDMKSANGSSGDEADGTRRRQGDGQQDLQETLGNSTRQPSGRSGWEASPDWGPTENVATSQTMVHGGQIRGINADGMSAKSPLLSCTMHNGTKVFLYKADITRLQVGAVVNAANERLQHGGGVAAAISNAIGWDFQRDSDNYIRKNRKVPLGTVSVQSTHFKMPAMHVINAVGPMWNMFRNKEECKEKLICAFLNSMKCANEVCIVRAVALPPISSGLFKVPIKVVAESLFDALVEFDSKCQGRRSVLKEVHIVDVNMTNLLSLKAILFCKFRQFDQK